MTDTGKPNHPTPGLSETIEDTSDNASDTPENKSSNVNNSNAAGVTLSDESFSLSDYEDYLNQHGFSDDAEDDYNDDLDVGDDNEDLHDSSDMNLERFTDNDMTDVNDVQDDDDAISHNSERRRRFRFKRDAGYQQWRHSLPGHQIKQKHEEDIVWEVCMVHFVITQKSLLFNITSLMVFVKFLIEIVIGSLFSLTYVP